MSTMIWLVYAGNGRDGCEHHTKRIITLTELQLLSTAARAFLETINSRDAQHPSPVCFPPFMDNNGVIKATLSSISSRRDHMHVRGPIF